MFSPIIPKQKDPFTREMDANFSMIPPPLTSDLQAELFPEASHVKFFNPPASQIPHSKSDSLIKKELKRKRGRKEKGNKETIIFQKTHSPKKTQVPPLQLTDITNHSCGSSSSKPKVDSDQEPPSFWGSGRQEQPTTPPDVKLLLTHRQQGLPIPPSPRGSFSTGSKIKRRNRSSQMEEIVLPINLDRPKEEKYNRFSTSPFPLAPRQSSINIGFPNGLPLNLRCWVEENLFRLPPQLAENLGRLTTSRDQEATTKIDTLRLYLIYWQIDKYLQQAELQGSQSSHSAFKDDIQFYFETTPYSLEMHQEWLRPILTALPPSIKTQAENLIINNTGNLKDPKNIYASLASLRLLVAKHRNEKNKQYKQVIDLLSETLTQGMQALEPHGPHIITSCIITSSKEEIEKLKTLKSSQDKIAHAEEVLDRGIPALSFFYLSEHLNLSSDHLKSINPKLFRRLFSNLMLTELADWEWQWGQFMNFGTYQLLCQIRKKSHTEISRNKKIKNLDIVVENINKQILAAANNSLYFENHITKIAKHAVKKRKEFKLAGARNNHDEELLKQVGVPFLALTYLRHLGPNEDTIDLFIDTYLNIKTQIFEWQWLEQTSGDEKSDHHVDGGTYIVLCQLQRRCKHLQSEAQGTEKEPLTRLNDQLSEVITHHRASTKFPGAIEKAVKSALKYRATQHNPEDIDRVLIDIADINVTYTYLLGIDWRELTTPFLQSLLQAHRKQGNLSQLINKCCSPENVSPERLWFLFRIYAELHKDDVDNAKAIQEFVFKSPIPDELYDTLNSWIVEDPSAEQALTMDRQERARIAFNMAWLLRDPIAIIDIAIQVKTLQLPEDFTKLFVESCADKERLFIDYLDRATHAYLNPFKLQIESQVDHSSITLFREVNLPARMIRSRVLTTPQYGLGLFAQSAVEKLLSLMREEKGELQSLIIKSSYPEESSPTKKKKKPGSKIEIKDDENTCTQEQVAFGVFFLKFLDNLEELFQGLHEEDEVSQVRKVILDNCLSKGIENKTAHLLANRVFFLYALSPRLTDIGQTQVEDLESRQLLLQTTKALQGLVNGNYNMIEFKFLLPLTEKTPFYRRVHHLP